MLYSSLISKNFQKFENYLCIFKEFENLYVEKKTLSTALGFETRSFDCRSNALTRRPKEGPLG